MSNRSRTGKDHYTLALEQYKRRDFIGTVQSIDKAISFGYRDYVVYDVKAAALSKLAAEGETVYRDQAMELIADMCKRWGKTDTRPWVRRAEYLRSMGFYKGALGAMDEALSIVKDDTKRQTRQKLITKRNVIAGEREKAQLEQDRRMATASKQEKEAIIAQKRKEAKSTQNFIHMISDDILLLITDHLMADNPNIVCRLSAVCTEWRDILYDRPYLWSNLVLGDIRPVLKATKFVERNKGKLKKLTLLPSFRLEHEEKVCAIIEPHIEGLEYFGFASRPSTLITNLRGRFDSLKEISQSARHPSVARAVDTDGTFCRPDRGMGLTKPTLERITIEDDLFGLGGDFYRTARYVQLVDAVDKAYEYLANLKSLKCRNSSFFYGRDFFETVHKNAPLLQEVEIDSCKPTSGYKSEWPEEGRDTPESDDDTQEEMTLEHLTSFIGVMDICFQTFTRFDTVHAPNLVRLELSSAVRTDLRTRSAGSDQSIVPYLRAAGLVDALPNLQVLDISYNVRGTELDDLMVIFAGLSSLRFLNISYTPFGDDFLRALTWGGQRDLNEQEQKPDLLPELVGLSVSGLEITSIALRDFVMSRLPKSKQEVPVIPTSHTIARSAFRPSGSASRSRSQPIIASVSSSQRPPSTQTDIPASSQSDLNSTGPNRQARFKWLCLDHVQTVDPQLSVYLASKLPFVSHSLRNKLVPDRMKGKGRYSWELDYYHSCADPSEEGVKCTVQRVLGTTDEYQIVHECGRHDTAYEVPEPDVLTEENIWCSQYNPQSTRLPKVPNPTPADPSERKTGDDEDVQVAQTQPVAGPSDDVSSVNDSKRPVPSTDPGAGSSKKLKSAKGKGKMKISIGENGFLSGF